MAQQVKVAEGRIKREVRMSLSKKKPKEERAKINRHLATWFRSILLSMQRKEGKWDL